MQFCSIERGLEFHFIALTVFFWGNLDTHTMLMGLLHTSQAITLHFFAPSFLLCIFSAATHNSRKANVNRPTFSRWLTILYTHNTIFPCVLYLFSLQHRIYLGLTKKDKVERMFGQQNEFFLANNSKTLIWNDNFNENISEKQFKIYSGILFPLFQCMTSSEYFTGPQ